jgi:mannosyltransferase OCH1-like enzyme
MKIPRIIHRIWLGGEEMPAEYVAFGETWRRHHPEWEFRTWTDSELPKLTFPDAFERCRNFGEASDVLRYEVLHQFGGVYVDTDVECLQPIDRLVERVSAFAGFARPNVIGSAIVGAVPEHPAITKTLEVVCAGAGSGPQVQATGPVALTRVLGEAEDVELFDRATFYPLDYWQIPFSDVDRGDLGESYAIHHWHATWQTRENLMLRTRELMLKSRERRQRDQAALKRKDRRLRAAADRETKLAAQLERAQSRLERIEGSRWWRLGRRLDSMRRAARRRAR